MRRKPSHDEFQESQALEVNFDVIVLQKHTAQHSQWLKQGRGGLRRQLGQALLDELFDLDYCLDTLGSVWKLELINQLLMPLQQLLDLLIIQALFP